MGSVMLKTTSLVCLILGALGSGCVVSAETDEDLGVGEDALGNNAIHEPQGRHTLGGLADGFTGPTPNHTLSVSSTMNVPNYGNVDMQPGDGACLKDPGTQQCAALVGTTMTGSDGSTLQIQSGVVVDAATKRWSYTVLRNGVALCANGAYPLGGRWRRDGEVHEAVSTDVTWACRGDGVAAKAVDWGFVPGAGPATSADWQSHQAAVRVGRADYCGDGQTHTFKNSLIELYDSNPSTIDAIVPSDPVITTAPSLPVSANSYVLEAAWQADAQGPGGTTPSVPLCLSRLRWQTFPLGNRCGGALKDPRVDVDGVYCEDWTLYDDLVSAGAILVNRSQINDVGLYRWTKASDSLTTVRGFASGSARPSVQPYGLNGYASPTREGTLLTDAGKAVVLSTFPNLTFVQLQVYVHAANGDRMATSTLAPPGNGYSAMPGGSDGWLLAAAPPAGFPASTAPLYRFKQSGGTDWLTTVSANAPAGYNQNSRALVGYILTW